MKNTIKKITAIIMAVFTITGTTACGEPEHNYTMETSEVTPLVDIIETEPETEDISETKITETADETIEDTTETETTNPVVTTIVSTAISETTVTTVSSENNTTSKPRVTVTPYIAGTRFERNANTIGEQMTTRVTGSWYVAKYRPTKPNANATETTETKTTTIVNTAEPVVPTETQHVHTWENVYKTVDIYEEQPIYEEVPVYEEQTVKEYHDFINDEGSEYRGFDMTEAYREYKAQGGTLDITTWGRMYLEYELGIVWWTYIRKPVYVKTQVQVGTETVQTGTETVKTGTKQEYDHKVCTTCGETE